jgi:uncharacterized protein (UPF0276 family)
MAAPALDGFGLGLRAAIHEDVLAGGHGVDWFEVITENVLGAGGNPRRVLRAVRERWPVALHGVSLSIGSTDPLDDDYLGRLAALIEEIEPSVVSDHLCWSSLGGATVHDLWPLPYTEAALVHVVERVGRVQDRLGRRILLENPSSYAHFAASAIPEAEFLAAVATGADCGILLDVNNVVVTVGNAGGGRAACRAYLDALPAERIGQIHLAGHDDGGRFRIDTHDRAVGREVWDLHAEAIARFGAVPTMIERDDDIPPFAELVAELEVARAVAAAALPARRAAHG